VGVADAVCTAVGPRAEVLAVGSQRATVELFDLSQPAAYLRTISLFDWGYSVEDTGPVSCIRWTPDNSAFAVGWCQRGLAVWSVSGCRLMCTIRQGSVSHIPHPPSPGGFFRPASKRSAEPMVAGVGGLAWAQHGYQLVAAEAKTAQRMVQFPFARMCVTRPVVGNSQVFQLMQVRGAEIRTCRCTVEMLRMRSR
jgi:WD40 repeat protein